MVKLNPSRILVTGTSGFVGKSLSAGLTQHGHIMRTAVRNIDPLAANIDAIEVGEIDGATDWTFALKNVDVAIHLAARVHIMNATTNDSLEEFRKVNVAGTLNLAREAAMVGVKRFIYISSIGVNGNSTIFNHPFTEEDKPNPRDPYSISKLEAELGLQKLSEETGLDIVIIRPPLVYGFEAPGNFKRIINVLKKRLPLPLGAIHNKRSFVYVGNLVNFILLCIDHPAAANQTFLVSDGQDISTTELLRGCAEALGVRVRLVPVPQKLIEVCAALIGKCDVAQRLCGSLQVDISKARTLLGWAPPISLADGLKATAMGLAKDE